jgi:hypothetical protein
MDVSDAKRLKALEEENGEAEAAACRRDARQHSAEGSARPKMVTPAVRRRAVAHLAETHKMSEAAGRRRVR